MNSFSKLWLNENDIITIINKLVKYTKKNKIKSDNLILGIGDDTAVIEFNNDKYVITTDLLIEGIHYNFSHTDPYTIGRRAMATNLSDLAAMGAIPRWGFLSLGLHKYSQQNFAKNLIQGIIDLGTEYNITIAGGDTVASPQNIINLCLIGTMEGINPPLRSAALNNHIICVTGWLGQAGGGLTWLLNGKKNKNPLSSPLIQAYLKPTPRLKTGRAITSSGRIGAMMDLSDGLISDLERIISASKVGAIIETEKLPINPITRKIALYLNKNPLDWALKSGDDYELLFTCIEKDIKFLAEIIAKSEPELKMTQIGRIVNNPGLWLIGPNKQQINIIGQGFKHF